MNKSCIGGVILLLLAGCSVATAPNGMEWVDFYAAKYRLKVTHNPADIVGCEEVGPVRGSDYADGGAAKDAAEEQAVILGGNALLYTRLWTEWTPSQPFARLRELHHADGVAYRCAAVE